jgi:hypothetical protein
MAYATLVEAAEGCDLLILKVKRSQPSAAPTEVGVSETGEASTNERVGDF